MSHDLYTCALPSNRRQRRGAGGVQCQKQRLLQTQRWTHGEQSTGNATQPTRVLIFVIKFSLKNITIKSRSSKVKPQTKMSQKKLNPN